MHDDYAETATRIRVYRQHPPDQDAIDLDDAPWIIDAVDDTGNYTEIAHATMTWRDAMDKGVPSVIAWHGDRWHGKGCDR